MGCMFLCNTPIPFFRKSVTSHNCPHFPATLKNIINPSIRFPFLLSPASPFTVSCSRRNGDPDQKLSSSSAFDVLGVDPNCSAEELKSAFRARVKEFHPDVRKDGRNSDTMIRLVIQAYEMLSNYRRSDVIERECLDPFENPECEAIDIFVNESLCVGKGCPYACVGRAPHAFAFSSTGTARATYQDMEKEQAKTFTRKLDLVGKTSLGYEGNADDYQVQLAVGQCPRSCIHYVTPSQRVILEELLDSILNIPYDSSAEADMLYSLIVKAKFENNRYQKPKKQPKASTKRVDWF